jgi:hypothetical protein
MQKAFTIKPTTLATGASAWGVRLQDHTGREVAFAVEGKCPPLLGFSGSRRRGLRR